MNYQLLDMKSVLGKEERLFNKKNLFISQGFNTLKELVREDKKKMVRSLHL